MKERPILFSGAMVRALLDDTKTQTRRAMKQQPIADRRFVGGYYIPATKRTPGQKISVWAPYVHIACPYGQPGDRLWVRETARCIMRSSNGLSGALQKPTMDVQYGAGGSERFDSFGDWFPGSNLIKGSSKPRWCPSIHMPRWASRITLEISSVRVERLHDISEADALAEGVDRGAVASFGRTPGVTRPAGCAYRDLWESINPAEIPLLDDDGKKVGVQKNTVAWGANPWVWVIEFKRLP